MDLTSVKARLSQLGYTPTGADDAILTYIMGTVDASVKRLYRLTTIPSDVDNIITDKVVGEFLLSKKNAGVALTGIDMSSVTEITDGDTTVKMDKSATPGAQLDTLIQFLLTGRDEVLIKLRSLSW